MATIAAKVGRGVTLGRARPAAYCDEGATEPGCEGIHLPEATQMQ